jgi:hypothetical protein
MAKVALLVPGRESRPFIQKNVEYQDPSAALAFFRSREFAFAQYQTNWVQFVRRFRDQWRRRENLRAVLTGERGKKE